MCLPNHHRRQSGFSRWTVIGSLLVVAGVAGLGVGIFVSPGQPNSAGSESTPGIQQNKTQGDSAAAKPNPISPMPATIPTPPQATNTENGPESVTVKLPAVPEFVDAFMRRQGMRVPRSIDKYCQFDFSTGAHPFFIQGDFDGDGQADYAINVEDKNQIGSILVFLASGASYKLGGRDYIHLVNRRGQTSTMEGSSVNLQNDAIGWVACEKSSGLYVFDKQKNAFEESFTSD